MFMKITFLTLNIWKGGEMLHEIVQFIKQVDPDIINFQEVYNGKDSHLAQNFRSYDYFNKKLPYKYSVFAPAFIYTIGSDSIEFGNATFSKFPICTLDTVFYDVPFGTIRQAIETDYSLQPRNLIHVTIAVDQKILNVFNTHGSWGTDGNDTPRRLTMSKKIIESVKNKSRVIVSGDFNTEPHAKTIRNIEKHLINIFKDQLQTSFNMKQKKSGNFSTAVVDHIFVSSDIKVLKKDAPNVNISDHLPLICTLEI